MLDVYGRVVGKTKVLLDHLGRDLFGKQRAVFVKTVRVFLEMLLAFRGFSTSPAHVVKTDGALHMRTAALNLADSDLAPWIRTQFGAPSDVKVRQHCLVLGVLGL